MEGMPPKNLMPERRRRKRLSEGLSMLRSVLPKNTKAAATWARSEQGKVNVSGSSVTTDVASDRPSSGVVAVVEALPPSSAPASLRCFFTSGGHLLWIWQHEPRGSGPATTRAMSPGRHDVVGEAARQPMIYFVPSDALSYRTGCETADGGAAHRQQSFPLFNPFNRQRFVDIQDSRPSPPLAGLQLPAV